MSKIRFIGLLCAAIITAAQALVFAADTRPGAGSLEVNRAAVQKPRTAPAECLWGCAP